jgi:protein-S-isoprenylcysteine O-methyltransferase Ste14
VAQFGERYRTYRRQVGMLVPRLRRRGDDEARAIR